ncbi:MAG TPA: TadE family protein, partial [Candidatus Limnocylindrales bacterium]|nr:TadE family protein [Candidatus Limnocylindrales bacterium]
MTVAGIARGIGRRGIRPTPRRGRPGRNGQSLVEFALALPVVLLMVLFGLDFGRVFLGWITLNNAVREAANFAALNPDGWAGTGIPTVQAEYQRLINTESAQINCTLPATLPSPTFPSGTDIGSPAQVTLTCRFALITPVISAILGNSVAVTSSAAFPVRSGAIEGIPVASTAPVPTPTPTVPPVPSPTPVATPSPTPTPTCLVPNLVGKKASNGTINTWTSAGFSANALIFNPAPGSPAYTIGHQS